MEEKKKGGKRNGAGRKPIPTLSKKITVTIFVSGANILKFGNSEKLKIKLGEYIELFGVETKVEVTPIPKYFDAPKMPVTFNDEPKQYQEAKISQFDAYKNEILATTWSGDLQPLMRIIKADTNIGSRGQLMLENIAKEHTSTFTN